MTSPERVWRTLRLFFAQRDSGISIHTDYHFPKLYRIRWPDGRVSPPGNLSRAKEAAISYARAYLGFGGHYVHNWHVTETRSGGAGRPPVSEQAPEAHDEGGAAAGAPAGAA